MRELRRCQLLKYAKVVTEFLIDGHRIGLFRGQIGDLIQSEKLSEIKSPLAVQMLRSTLRVGTLSQRTEALALSSPGIRYFIMSFNLRKFFYGAVTPAARSQLYYKLLLFNLHKMDVNVHQLVSYKPKS